MLYPKPRICAFNLQEEIVSKLKERYEDVFEGSLDVCYEMSVSLDSPQGIYSNYKFPENIHEYDVFILDLQRILVQRYYHQINHDGRLNSDHLTLFFIGKYEGSYLDARVEGLKYFDERVREIHKSVLIIIFNGAYNEYDYPIKNGSQVRKYNTFPFQDLSSLYKHNRSGIEIIPSEDKTALNIFINKFIKEIVYQSSFDIPYVVKRENLVSTSEQDPSYEVILKNSNEQMISFKKTYANRTFLVLPYIANKEDFLLKFVDGVAFETFPDFFQDSQSNAWLNTPPYLSINEEVLLQKRADLKMAYQKEDEEVYEKIIEDRKQNSPFYEILYETGDNLVTSVAKVLEGFLLKNVEIADKSIDKKLKEEDLKVTLEDGSIILLEVKGIYGTSKDDDCSQIYKVINRRKQALKRFDIRGIYLVNHHRGIAPLKRANPPFSLEQIKDAETDERGLLTTWELFKAWRMFQIQVLSFDHFIMCLTKSGLINFDPDLIKEIGTVKKYYPRKNASIIDITDKINVGDEILLLRDEIYRTAIIKSIQINGKSEVSATNCEVGIVATESLDEETRIFKKIKA